MAYTLDPHTQRSDLAFVRQVMREPLLGREEEQQLANAWYFEHDEHALHHLIRAYARLVVSTALRFRHHGLPLNDLIQEGNLGLMQAAERFEPDRDVRFSTYAKWWIRSSIQDFILRNWSIVRTGSTAAQKQLFFNLRRLRAQLTSVTNETMSHEEREKIADNLHVTIHDVEDMEYRLAAHDFSLSNPVNENGNEDWVDFLADQRPDPEASASEHLDAIVQRTWIQSAMHNLTQRERYIIAARRLSEQPITLEILGKKMSISKERVRQLEARAIRKMRHHLLNNIHDAREML